MQRYAGSRDEEADGYDRDLYNRGRISYEGDIGESKFLDKMRHVDVAGGLLIGNVDTHHLSYGGLLSDDARPDFMMPQSMSAMVRDGM